MIARRWATAIAAAALGLAVARRAPAEPRRELTREQAVAIALRQNRDVIAAKLEIRAAELDQVAAELYPNPVFFYNVANLPLGAGNPGNAQAGAPASPGFFAQPVQTWGVSEIVDIWSKRGARVRAADRGLEVRRWLVADALREISHEVRSAFANVQREQAEQRLSHDMLGRYEETVRLSRARMAAGEISEADLRKIELEELKYRTDVITAETEHEIARQRLAALLGVGSEAELPETLAEDDPPRVTEPAPALVARAMKQRPDVMAASRGRAFAEAALGAARREALPDVTLSASYTHSAFLASGDNPNTLAFGVALPLPLFDRNQANVGRGDLAVRRADNEAERLVIAVRQEVTSAARRAERADALTAVFQAGGMLERAETSLRVAEKSYQAGAMSLIELLEAQRTSLATRAEYLRALHERRQAQIDLQSAMGSQ